MRVVLLILALVLAPFCAFFLWAWAVKIKQERRIAGTLPDLAGHRGLRLRHRRLHRHVLHPGPGLRRALRIMKPSGRLEPPPWANDTAVHTLFGALGAAGITARFVGGWVRDAVRGVTLTKEPDLAVDKPPETVMLALKASRIKVVPTGLKHGTVTAVIAGAPYELTTLRRDVETDGRHAVVAFTDDWLEDASRRDFTFNALYADLDGTLYDPFEGRADLAAKHVRFIGDADQRIAEDKLRILRFFRFHAWLGRPPFDAAGFMACRRNAGGLRGLSGERVRKEFLRLLDAPAPSDTVDAMREAAILDHWLPECDGAARLRALIARSHRSCRARPMPP